MGEVVQLVTFQVKPEFRQHILSLLLDVAAESQREVGCKQYMLTVSEDDPNTFVIWEHFEDQTAVERHSISPHVKRWRLERDKLPEGALMRVTRRLLLPDIPTLFPALEGCRP